VTWKPRHDRCLLVAPLEGSGVQRGIVVHEDARRNKMMGYVLATRGCHEVTPDDIVLYEEGSGELLKDSSGESVTWLKEIDCTAIDPDLWPKPKNETQTATGLVLPGYF
jgi:co-chaperonin GroES (HSP10)